MRRGGRGGGGLYGNFVSANDNVENKAYRGAMIPPPPSLNHGSGSSGSGGILGAGNTAAIARASGGSSGISNIQAMAKAMARDNIASSRSQAAGGLPPPSIASNVGLGKPTYASMDAINDSSLSYSQYGVTIKRARTEDDYFNSDDEGKGDDEDKGKLGAQDDDEEDELDAYMKELEKQAATKGVSNSAPGVTETAQGSSGAAKGTTGKTALKTGMIQKTQQSVKTVKGTRADIDGEDEEESYYRWLEENPNAGKAANDDEDDIACEYDADGNPVAPVNSKHIDPLTQIDHSTINYEKFEKNFYEEHPDIVGLSRIQIIDLQQKLNVKVSGPSPSKPVTSFGHFGFDEPLMKAIRKSEFTSPTPIQAMGIPAVLSGRDVIGIAQTGSGKTCSFIWPMLVHVMDQRELKPNEGPIALVLVPTRELALQIYTETKKYGRVYNIHVVCAYGGGNKYEQSKAFEQGAEIAIATPGRMIDMIKMKVTNLERVTYLVMDEADRMFDMGFEPQVRSLCDHVRPDRQCQMYSATFKKRIEKLARDVLTDPIKVVQGDVGVTAENVTQNVMVVPLGGYKWQWLTKSLVSFMSEGSVLVFVTKKQNCEELAHNLKVKAEIDCRGLHGDMFQNERNEIIGAFKKQEFPVLVATDVAARGLDIPHIRNVVNFDLARDIDTHTHRVGRTGRAGMTGMAHTMVTVNDKEFAGHLVRNLEAAGQAPPKELYDLAIQSSWFKNSRFKHGRGKGVGGLGLGFKERPSLTYSEGGQTDTSISEQFTYDKKHSKGLARPGTDRIASVKQAYKNQFMSGFRAAETDEGGFKPNAKIIEETKRKKPSRWE